jgi:hypothetical protein
MDARVETKETHRKNRTTNKAHKRQTPKKGTLIGTAL